MLGSRTQAMDARLSAPPVMVVSTPSIAEASDGDPYVSACLTARGCQGWHRNPRSSPVSLAESPDGKQIYAGTFASGGGLPVFRSSIETRTRVPRYLAQEPGGFAGTGFGAPCTLVGSASFGEGLGIAVSPDGRNVYLSTQDDRSR